MESLSFSLSLDRKYKSIEISWRNEYSKSTEPKPIRGVHTMGGGKSFWSVCIVGLPVTNAYKLSPWHAEKGMQVGVAAIRARRFETRIRCSSLFFFFFSSNELGGSVWYNFDRKLFFAVLRDAKIKVSVEGGMEYFGGRRGGKEESIGRDRENGISRSNFPKWNFTVGFHERWERRREAGRYFRSRRSSRVSFLRKRSSHFRAPRLLIDRGEQIPLLRVIREGYSI